VNTSNRGDHRLPLLGRGVVVATSRNPDRLAEQLRRLGAQVVSCPLMRLDEPEDQVAVDDFVKELCAGTFDKLIFLTGEGVRRLSASAARQRLFQTFRERLKNTKVIARGPKPTAAIESLGASVDLRISPPTTEGILSALRHMQTRGQHIGIQLSGQTNPKLVEGIRALAAHPRAVIPYVYGLPRDQKAVRDVIEKMATGSSDAIAFTSAPQVDQLFEIATRDQFLGRVTQALRRVLVSCMGPVAAEALADRGIKVALELDSPFVSERLGQALAARLGPTPSSRSPVR